MKHGQLKRTCGLSISEDERKSLRIHLIPNLLKVLNSNNNDSTIDCYELYEHNNLEKYVGVGDSYCINIRLKTSRVYRNEQKARIWLNGIQCQIGKCEYEGGIIQYSVCVWLSGTFCEYRRKNKIRLFDWRHYYDFDTEIHNLVNYDEMKTLFNNILK